MVSLPQRKTTYRFLGADGVPAIPFTLTTDKTPDRENVVLTLGGADASTVTIADGGAVVITGLADGLIIVVEASLLLFDDASVPLPPGMTMIEKAESAETLGATIQADAPAADAGGHVLVLTSVARANADDEQRFTNDARRLNQYAEQNLRGGYKPWFGVRKPSSGGLQLVFGIVNGQVGIDKDAYKEMANALDRAGYKGSHWEMVTESAAAEVLPMTNQDSVTAGQSGKHVLVLATVARANPDDEQRFANDARRLNQFAEQNPQRYQPWFGVRKPSSGGLQLVYGPVDGQTGIDKERAGDIADALDRAGYRGAHWVQVSDQ